MKLRKRKNVNPTPNRLKNFRLRNVIANRLELVAAQERRTEIAVVELALECYFRLNGYPDNRSEVEVLNDSVKRVGYLTISKTHRLCGQIGK